LTGTTPQVHTVSSQGEPPLKAERMPAKDPLARCGAVVDQFISKSLEKWGGSRPPFFSCPAPACAPILRGWQAHPAANLLALDPLAFSTRACIRSSLAPSVSRQVGLALSGLLWLRGRIPRYFRAASGVGRRGGAAPFNAVENPCIAVCHPCPLARSLHSVTDRGDRRVQKRKFQSPDPGILLQGASSTTTHGRSSLAAYSLPWS